MALAAVKTFISGEVLFAADLNALNTNILNNALALISPLTGNLNFNNTQALSFRMENLSATPAAGQVGRIVFQTSQNQPEVDDGSFIRRVPAILTTTIATGDLITASTAGTWSRLAVGSSAQGHLVATSSNALPVWAGGPASTGGLEYIRAWVTFDGTTTSSGVTPLDAFGVSTAINTIIKNSSGSFTIPWQQSFANVNYALTGCLGFMSSAVEPLVLVLASSGQQSSQANIFVKRGDGAIFDSSFVHILAAGRV